MAAERLKGQLRDSLMDANESGKMTKVLAEPLGASWDVRGLAEDGGGRGAGAPEG